MELLDVYTVNREKTGRTIPRGCGIAVGERLLVVHVCVMNDRQEMLIQRGYSCGSYGADGKFGNATLAALRSSCIALR